MTEMKKCVFCGIVAGDVPCHKIWEDQAHLAFLSIFPNTEGFSVVIPKRHYSSYAFALEDEVLCQLVLAAKQVGTLIDRNLPGVGRTGMIFEGFGVDHIHAKLFPMHGTAGMHEWQPIKSAQRKFFHKYEGYISSHDGERSPDERLAHIAATIRGESRSNVSR
jgi:diadenosine tetraphosphate (Ap4A) HIT family hydrolase